MKQTDIIKPQRIKYVKIKMGDTYRKIMALLLFMTGTGGMAAPHTYTDSLAVTVHFPCGEDDISCIPQNIPSLNRYIQQLDSLFPSPEGRQAGIFITSSTSPEGSLDINRSLARRRRQSLLDFLNRHSATFRILASTNGCTFSEQTTNDLFAQTPPSAYAPMRRSRVVIHYRTAPDSMAVAEPSLPDTMHHQSPTGLPPSEEEESAVAATSPEWEMPASSPSVRPLFWVKTNLLADLLTGVNVSVEIPLAKHFTAEATLVHPWWRSTERHKTLQLRYVAVTPRYYFKRPATPYTSFFAGITVGGGTYDLQWTRRGVQGRMWHASPLIGYSHPISRRWKMEYAVSVGFVHTAYQKYTQTPATPYGEIKVKDYPWVRKVSNTVCPTSLSVSLIYTLTKAKHTEHHER